VINVAETVPQSPTCLLIELTSLQFPPPLCDAIVSNRCDEVRKSSEFAVEAVIDGSC
jgi:hypothetical protein